MNATGTLNCAASGKAKINPPLIFGGTTPTDIVTKVKLVCSGTSGITSGKGTITQHIPVNDCANPTTGSTGVFTWKGAAKYNPSTVAFGVGNSTISALVVTDSSGPATGSFQGKTVLQHSVLDQTVVSYTTSCTAKTKGLKGSGGTKKTSYTGINGVSTLKVN